MNAMNTRDGNMNLLRPFFRVLTDAYKTIGRNVTAFVSSPHTPVPELLDECALVCQTVGFLAGQRFSEACADLAYSLRSQSSTEGFRLLAAGVNAIGLYCKGLAEGGEASYSALNHTFRRLNEGKGLDADQLFMPMFRTVDAEDSWYPPVGAKEEVLKQYIYQNLQNLGEMDIESLKMFFRSLESRNANRGVKTFIDAAMCVLELEQISEPCVESIGINLSELATNGYNGLNVMHVSRLLQAVSSSNLANARAKSLELHILSDRKGSTVDVDLARKFAAALDTLKDLVKKHAHSDDFSKVQSGCGQLSAASDRLGSAAIKLLSEGISSAALGSDDNGHDLAWINIAMAVILMKCAVDQALRGLPEDSLLDVSSEVVKRLHDPSIPLNSALPTPGAFIEHIQSSAISSLCDQTLKEIASMRTLVEQGCKLQEESFADNAILEQVGLPLMQKLRAMEFMLLTLGSDKASALASLGAHWASDPETWHSPGRVQSLTDVISTLLLGFERLSGRQTPKLDDLIIHEIAAITPELIAEIPTLADSDVLSPKAEIQAASGLSSVDIFIEESLVLFDNVNASLLDASNDVEVARSLEWARELVRLIHTLRAGAKVSGMPVLSSVAEEAEEAFRDWLESWDDAEITAEAALEMLIQANAAVNALQSILNIEGVESGHTQPDDLAAFVGMVRASLPAASATPESSQSSFDSLIEEPLSC